MLLSPSPFLKLKKTTYFCHEQHCPLTTWSLSYFYHYYFQLYISMYYQMIRVISCSRWSGGSVPSIFPPQLFTPKPQRRQLPTRYQALFVVLLSCGQLYLQSVPAGRELSSTRTLGDLRAFSCTPPCAWPLFLHGSSSSFPVLIHMSPLWQDCP